MARADVVPADPDVTTAEPGTHGDPMRALALEPAVVTSSGLAIDGLALRGATPAEARVLVDGFDVPLLFHFGARGVLPDEALHAGKLTTGAFDAQYGRATSGVLELETPAGGNAFELSTEQLSGRRTALINRKVPLIFSLRIGLLSAWASDSVVHSITHDDTHVTGGPGYGDFSMYTWGTILDHWTLAMRGLFSDEGVTLYTERGELPEHRISTGRTFGRLTVTATYREQWDATIAASVMPYIYRFERGLVQHDRDDSLSLDASVVAVRRIGWVWGLWPFSVYVGGDVHATRHDLDVAMPQQARENAPQLGPSDPNDISQRFTGIVWRPDAGVYGALEGGFTRALSARVGGRIDVFGDDVSLQPRLELADQLAEHTRLALRGGTYRRPPEDREELQHSDLGAERATQIELELRHHVQQATSLLATVYYVDRTHLVERLNDELRNTGRGTDLGAELTVQRIRGPWLGRLALGLAHSTRQDTPASRERPSAFDQPVHVDALVAWQRGGWMVGARFELRSGLPYTPVQAAIYDVDRDAYVPIAGVQYGERAPLHHQLDLRVDYRFVVRKRIALDAYLDVANVYDDRSASGYVYSYDFSQRTALESLPIWPTVGLRGTL